MHSQTHPIGKTCSFLERTALRVAAAVLVAVVAMPAACEAAERRIAFVVGNSDYQSVPKLPNPDHDAEAVAKALRRSGFEVVTALNLSRVDFDKALEKYIRSLNGADISMFYYSGHGIQVNGDNHIIPVDAELKSAADLEVETVSVKTIMSYMQSDSKVQLVYLDSCRNNPFPSQQFLVGPDKQVAVAGVGLAPQSGTLGAVVAFSTQPGAIAVDGTGDTSPFTDAMLKHSFKIGVDVQSALTKVTDDVWQATNHRQKPWANITLTQAVYLAKPAIRIVAAQPADAGKTVTVQVGAAPQQGDKAEQVASDTSTQIAALLEETFNEPHRVPIGVGQVAMLGDFPIIRAATGAQLEISKVPPSGVLYLDGKPLAEGDVLDQNSVRNVTFEPAIGSERKVMDVEFKVSQAGNSGATVVDGKIEPFVMACDAEAGEPLDLQGVAAGKLPNEIDAEKAIAACNDAIAKYPGIARYKYQLGRAKLAAKDVAGALEQFNAAAEAGHTRAFYELGYLAQRGLGRKQDLAEANRLFKVGSDLGDPYAMLSYGRNLVRGRGVGKDVSEGIRLLNKSVELGHTYAMNALGAMYYYGENLKANGERGVRFFEASMARGDIYAMHNMGIAYLEGKGVKKDSVTALALFKKASDGGHPNAPTSIGAMYYKGNGVKKDPEAAMHWYDLGAERGDFWAASNLAFIYSKGAKTQRDPDKAVWYSSLAVALDAYGENPGEKANLARLPADAKKRVMKKLIAEIGSAGLETTDTLDATLVMLSRKAWQLRNPRLDLF